MHVCHLSLCLWERGSKEGSLAHLWSRCPELPARPSFHGVSLNVKEACQRFEANFEEAPRPLSSLESPCTGSSGESISRADCLGWPDEPLPGGNGHRLPRWQNPTS
ncbi:hypothetical protein WJX74_002661 [Apatococcus lobatus]|uniref:Uncharacterized protein n=1 Tax=Apatococcus lobatus TaxID=904363 RepID=A0AAW1QUR0_9CHLO